MSTQQQEQQVAVEKDLVIWVVYGKEKLAKTEFKPIFATNLASDGNYHFDENFWHGKEIEVVGLTSNYDKNIDWLRSNYNLYKRQYRDYAIDCNVRPANENDYFLNCEHVGSGSHMLVIEKENHFFETYTVNKAVFYMPNEEFKKWVESKLNQAKNSDFESWRAAADSYYFRHRFDR